MIIWLCVIGLVLLCVLSGILTYLLTIAQNKIDIYEEWILEFKNDVNGVYRQLKNIDDKNLFEKDDDVGVIFSEMSALIDKLNTRIKTDVNTKKEIQENE
jgi:hypothetical protein